MERQHGDHRPGPKVIISDVALDRGLDWRDEHVALAVNGLDDLLLAPGVAQRPTEFLDLGRQCRFAHETITPHGVEEFVLGDDPVPILDQGDQNTRRPRLDGDALAVPAQLPTIDVELAVGEAHHHLGTYSQRAL